MSEALAQAGQRLFMPVQQTPVQYVEPQLAFAEPQVAFAGQAAQAVYYVPAEGQTARLNVSPGGRDEDPISVTTTEEDPISVTVPEEGPDAEDPTIRQIGDQIIPLIEKAEDDVAVREDDSPGVFAAFADGDEVTTE